MPHDKKNNKHQKRQQSPKAPGLVNANHFFETGEELANRHLEAQRKAQGRPKQQQQRNQARRYQENPENPQQ